MNPLLSIASKVEAAVEAYIAVRDFADQHIWRAGLKRELKAATREILSIKGNNGGVAPPLHPTLVALSIVLEYKEDLGNITRSHPKRQEHTFYDTSAVFPEDISNLLPPSKDRWWEPLAKAAEAARREHAALNPPQVVPPALRRVRVRLTLPTQPSPPSPPPPPEEEPSENMSMEVDELEDSRGRGRPGASEEASAARKRKNSSAATVARGSAKRRAKSRQRPDAAEQTSMSGGDHAGSGIGGNMAFECDRCVRAGDICGVLPTGPCQQCKAKKLKCSLMPLNPKTGKTDRRTLSASELLEFRVKQAEEQRTEVQRGKQRASGFADAAESDGSAPNPSPLDQISAMNRLTLDSGGSSAANTPADSPHGDPQPLLPVDEEPAPPSASKARKARKAPKPSQSFVVEVPAVSRLLKPLPRQASSSRSVPSPASDDGSNSARIAFLESRLTSLETEQENLVKEVQELRRKVENMDM